MRGKFKLHRFYRQEDQEKNNDQLLQVQKKKEVPEPKKALRNSMMKPNIARFSKLPKIEGRTNSIAHKEEKMTFEQKVLKEDVDQENYEKFMKIVNLRREQLKLRNQKLVRLPGKNNDIQDKQKEIKEEMNKHFNSDLDVFSPTSSIRSMEGLKPKQNYNNKVDSEFFKEFSLLENRISKHRQTQGGVAINIERLDATRFAKPFSQIEEESPNQAGNRSSDEDKNDGNQMLLGGIQKITKEVGKENFTRKGTLDRFLNQDNSNFLQPIFNTSQLKAKQEPSYQAQPSFMQSTNVAQTKAQTANISINSDMQLNEEEERELIMKAEKERKEPLSNLQIAIHDEPIHNIELPPLIIHPNAYWKTTWDILMLFLISYLSITIPYRIPFEDVTTPAWAYSDIIIDSVFWIDMIFNFFTAYEDDNGEFITNRFLITKNYVKNWFFVDFLSSIPISLIQRTTDLDSFENVRLIKLSRLPRLYRILRLMKLIKLYKTNKFVNKILKQINISVLFSKMILSILMMVFLHHMVGCMWATVANISDGEGPQTWFTANQLHDAENYEKYIASVYWAAVTIYTVGYGDITPTNNYERAAAICIQFTGVSLYAWMFANLSTTFNNVTSKISKKAMLIRVITILSIRHRFTDELRKNMLYFYSFESDDLISLSKDYGITELLAILPLHLKSQVCYCLYREAIDTIRILQNEEQSFYGEYIMKLELMRIKTGMVVAKEGSSPQEVYFLLSGCIFCEKQKKYYLEGTIFGECDIVMNRNRLETYVTKGDCQILKLERSVFEEIMVRYQSFREEVQIIVVEREKKRIQQLQKSKYHHNVQRDQKELDKLVSTIDFEKIKERRRNAIVQRKSSMGANELNQLLGFSLPNGEIQSISELESLVTESQDAVSNRSLIQKQYENTQTKPKEPYKSNFTRNHEDDSNDDDDDEEELRECTSLSDKEYNEEEIKEILQKLRMQRKTEVFKSRINFETPINSKSPVTNKNVSAFNFRMIQDQDQGFGSAANHVKKEMEESRQNKISMHLQRIETIKNNIINQMTQEEDFNKDKFMERIQETKKQIRVMTSRRKHEGSDIQSNVSVNQFQFEDQQQRIPTQEEFKQQLTVSLQRLKESIQQESILRKSTQKDRPVQGGNNQQDNQSLISFQKNSNRSSHYNITVQEINIITPRQEVDNLDEEIVNLAKHIKLCQASIGNTYLLLTEYVKLFKETLSQLESKEDHNLQIKENLVNGINCVESYQSIVGMISKFLDKIDIVQVMKKVKTIREKVQTSESKFYYLENKVKAMQEVLYTNIRQLEKEMMIKLMNKPLMIVKKNPLLDSRDFKHSQMNMKLESNDNSMMNF